MGTLASRAAMAVVIAVLVSEAYADSYPKFKNLLERDRLGLVVADVRGSPDRGTTEKSVTITVWTRLDPRALQRLQRQSNRPRREILRETLSPGPTRTLYTCTLSHPPALVRLTTVALASVGYHGINYGELKRGPAVQIVGFSSDVNLSFGLDELFANGTERYHNDRGKVHWLQDAWFSAGGDRFFVLSPARQCNGYVNELAIIDLQAGLVEQASRATIRREVDQVEKRHLHNAFEAARNNSVDGIDEVARRIFYRKEIPLAARVRAAVHLAGLGNHEASQLVRDLAALRSVDPADVEHPAVSNVLVFDEHYWWNTIGYAAKTLDKQSK